MFECVPGIIYFLFLINFSCFILVLRGIKLTFEKVKYVLVKCNKLNLKLMNYIVKLDLFSTKRSNIRQSFTKIITRINFIVGIHIHFINIIKC